MNKYLCISLLTGTIIFSIGCTNQQSWSYRVQTAPTNWNESNKSVVILPFHDQRENSNVNNILLSQIPLVPKATTFQSTPEGQAGHVNSSFWLNYSPAEDFPKALSQELNASGLFEEAYFAFRKGESDFYLRGTIKKTEFKGTLYSYCLSSFGSILWVLGAPAVKVESELVLDLALVNNNSGEVLFSKTYDATKKDVSWIYNLKNDFHFPELLQNVYSEFVTDLRNSGRVN